MGLLGSWELILFHGFIVIVGKGEGFFLSIASIRQGKLREREREN